MVQNLENVLNLNVCQTEKAKPGGCDTLQDEWQIHPTLELKEPGLCLTRWSHLFQPKLSFWYIFLVLLVLYFYIYSRLSP